MSSGGTQLEVMLACFDGDKRAAKAHVAGTLYGLYEGRAVTAGRLKAFGPLLPPDTSAVLAWAEGPVTRESIATWETTGSEELAVRINKAPHGAILEV